MRISKGAKKRAEKAAIQDELLRRVEHHRSTKKDNPVITNRMERRSNLQLGQVENMRKIKRAQRFTTLKDEAATIKKKFRKNFKNQERWKEIELEVGKILGRKGESNTTKAKKKR